MKEYIDALKRQLAENPPNLDGSESVLAFLYESYSQVNRMDDDQIKVDFNELYQAMNGMTLQEMDQILDPVCTLCRDHERYGFVQGVQIGVLLGKDIPDGRDVMSNNTGMASWISKG